jgi:hypothetical protein
MQQQPEPEGHDDHHASRHDDFVLHDLHDQRLDDELDRGRGTGV